MQLVMTDIQNVEITASPRDARGRAAKLENPIWESSDPSVFSVLQDDLDPLRARGSALAPGSALLTFRADSDLSDAVLEIVGTLAVIVQPSEGGQAIVVDIVADKPSDRPL